MTTQDLRSDAFQRALDEAGRRDRPPDAEAGATGGARVSCVAFGVPPSSGGEARFGPALDWTEPADRPAPPSPQFESPARPSDTPTEIAAELGLDATMTADQLTSRWRNFVWRNHPDRQPVNARERANRRVAIANTLYSQARRELAKALGRAQAPQNKRL